MNMSGIGDEMMTRLSDNGMMVGVIRGSIESVLKGLSKNMRMKE